MCLHIFVSSGLECGDSQILVPHWPTILVRPNSSSRFCQRIRNLDWKNICQIWLSVCTWCMGKMCDSALLHMPVHVIIMYIHLSHTYVWSHTKIFIGLKNVWTLFTFDFSYQLKITNYVLGNNLLLLGPLLILKNTFFLAQHFYSFFLIIYSVYYYFKFHCAMYLIFTSFST